MKLKDEICGKHLSGTIGHACVDKDPFVQRFSFKLLTRFEVNTLIQWIFYGKILYLPKWSLCPYNILVNKGIF